MLTFRPLQWQDVGPLYVWRHDPETVKWSLKPPPTWDEHLQYINSVISHASDVTVMFVGYFLNIPVVCVSRDDDFEVNIMVNPPFRRRGFATEALEWLQAYFPVGPLDAVIKKDNEASVHLFTKCGFKYATYQGRPDDILVMEWNP